MTSGVPKRIKIDWGLLALHVDAVGVYRCFQRTLLPQAAVLIANLHIPVILAVIPQELRLYNGYC